MSCVGIITQTPHSPDLYTKYIVPIRRLLLFLHASTNFLQLWIFFWQWHSETSLILTAGWHGMAWDCLVQKGLHSIFPSFFIFTFPYHFTLNASMDPSTELCTGISTSHVRSRTGVNKFKDKSFEAQISQLSSTTLLPGPENWPLVQRWDSWRNSKLEWFLQRIGSANTQIASLLPWSHEDHLCK